MKNFFSLRNIFLLLTLFMVGCHPYYFIQPRIYESAQEVKKEQIGLSYICINDGRPEIEKETEEEKACLSSNGMVHIADDWYRTNKIKGGKVFYNAFDRHLLLTLDNSNAFKIDSTENEALKENYFFSSNLESVKLTYDGTKPMQTKACIGGLIGELVAMSQEVTTNTDIIINAKLSKDGKEVWSHKVTYHRFIKDTYKNEKQIIERSINEAIGESCGEISDELLKYFNSVNASM